MIKNLTVSLTDRCNGNCSFCNISRNFQNELSFNQFELLLDNPLFSQIDTLSLSGGEMFLHPQVKDIVLTATNKPKFLQRLFINTNGLRDANDIYEIISLVPEHIKCIISISYEGGVEENHAIRGYDNSNNIITLSSLVKEKRHISISLSMTLCENNCSLKSLYGTKQLADTLNCDFSFRLSEVSESYYKNKGYSFVPSPNQIADIITFINDNCSSNPFLRKYSEFLKTGKVTYMGKERNCIAGSVFAFVNSDGNIYPCIYSDKPIGNISSTSLSQPESTDHCLNCYTDCIAWPMIEYFEAGVKKQ